MVNAWQLLLKARILQRNKNNLGSIYIVDPNKTRNDGTSYRKPKFKTSRSGNYLTIDLTNAMKELNLQSGLSVPKATKIIDKNQGLQTET